MSKTKSVENIHLEEKKSKMSNYKFSSMEPACLLKEGKAFEKYVEWHIITVLLSRIFTCFHFTPMYTIQRLNINWFEHNLLMGWY